MATRDPMPQATKLAAPGGGGDFASAAAAAADALSDAHDGLRAVLHDGCLRYDGQDSPSHRDRARSRLAADPSLVDADIFVVSMLGRSRSVKQFLAEDAKLAVTPGGPRGWPPLLYLCYGRVPQFRRDGESFVAAATALLDAGADANSRFRLGDSIFTALTGCFGEGEGGPKAQPENPEGLKLAQLLLKWGADPNDGQALYNQMFSPGSTCLEVLIEAGLNGTHRINWSKGGEEEQPAQTTLSYQLYYAARKRGHQARVALLLRVKADVNEQPVDDVEGNVGRSVWRAAVMGGNADVAAMLEAAGAVPEELDAVDRFTAAFRGARHEEARALLETDAGVFAAAEERHDDLLMHAVDTGDLEGIELALSTGLDINRNTHTPMAHHAAFHGQLAALRLVLERKADPMVRDERHHCTALEWASHAGQDAAASLLAALPAVAASLAAAETAGQAQAP